MSIPLLALHVRSRRDVLIVRQRSRQIAGLLGFDEAQRGIIAAAVFEMACQHDGPEPIRFQLRGDSLLIGRLVFALPDPCGTPPRDDIPWLVRTLDDITPANLFDEIRQQNNDLLRLLGDRENRHAA